MIVTLRLLGKPKERLTDAKRILGDNKRDMADEDMAATSILGSYSNVLE